MNAYETFQRQPDFPFEDVCEENIAPLIATLGDHSIETKMAEAIGNSMLGIFTVARQALRESGIKVPHTQYAYEAFKSGYATLDYIHFAVNPGSTADASSIAPVSQPNKNSLQESWATTFPNLHTIVHWTTSTENEESFYMPIRMIGARYGHEQKRAS